MKVNWFSQKNSVPVDISVLCVFSHSVTLIYICSPSQNPKLLQDRNGVYHIVYPAPGPIRLNLNNCLKYMLLFFYHMLFPSMWSYLGDLRRSQQSVWAKCPDPLAVYHLPAPPVLEFCPHPFGLCVYIGRAPCLQRAVCIWWASWKFRAEIESRMDKGRAVGQPEAIW